MSYRLMEAKVLGRKNRLGDAKHQYVRCSRTTMAALERQLEQRRKAEVPDFARKN